MNGGSHGFSLFRLGSFHLNLLLSLSDSGLLDVLLDTLGRSFGSLSSLGGDLSIGLGSGLCCLSGSFGGFLSIVSLSFSSLGCSFSWCLSIRFFRCSGLGGVLGGFGCSFDGLCSVSSGGGSWCSGGGSLGISNLCCSLVGLLLSIDGTFFGGSDDLLGLFITCLLGLGAGLLSLILSALELGNGSLSLIL